MIGKHLDNQTRLGENPRLEGPVGVAVLGPKRLVLISGVALVIATVP
jgi:hypothetical protein